jgi:hypothetical protein
LKRRGLVTRREADVYESRESHSQHSHVINPNLLRTKGSNWTEQINEDSPGAGRVSSREGRGARLIWRGSQKKDREGEDGDGSEEMEEQDGDRKRDLKSSPVPEEVEGVDKERRMNEEIVAIVLGR